MLVFHCILYFPSLSIICLLCFIDFPFSIYCTFFISFYLFIHSFLLGNFFLVKTVCVIFAIKFYSFLLACFILSKFSFFLYIIHSTFSLVLACIFISYLLSLYTSILFFSFYSLFPCLSFVPFIFLYRYPALFQENASPPMHIKDIEK